MTISIWTLRRVSRRAVPIALCLAPALALAEPELPAVEHSDCIIEPMVVVEVGTSVAGVIDDMLVDRSDRVDSGQLLARLESSVEEVTVRRSKERADMLSEIRARVADLKLAKQKMQRINDLHARKMVSKQQRDEAVNELERADQAVKIAREKLHLAKLDLEHAQAQLDRRQIRSPIKGVILERLAQAGEYVDERPLLSVAQLDPLRVEVLMPAQAFGVIQPGMTANVMPELAAQAPLAAKVVLVDPIIDTASGTFGVRLELPNADYAIPSGMRCRVSFVGSESEQESVATESGEVLDDAGFLAPTLKPPIEVEAQTAEDRAIGDQDGDQDSDPVDTTVVMQPKTTESLPPEPPATEPTLLQPTAAGAAEADPHVDLELVEIEPERASECWRLGPWDTATDRDTLAEQLDRLGAQIRPQEDRANQHRRWMVYLPGRNGVDTADQLTRLVMAGVEDLYVVRRGAQRGDVSTGLFKHKRNAQRRVRQLSARGFAAQVTPFSNPVARYWLEVRGIAEPQLDAIDGLAESIKAATACAEPDDRLLLGNQPAGQVISHAD